MPKDNLFPVRAVHKQDSPFIFATWLDSYWANCPYLIGIHKNDFYNGHKNIVQRLLNKATVLIAHDEDDEDHIYGYLVYEARRDFKIMHYLYVKFPCRRFGIARCLLTWMDTEFQVSHWTKDFEKYLAKAPGLVYNPYLALGDV